MYPTNSTIALISAIPIVVIASVVGIVFANQYAVQIIGFASVICMSIFQILQNNKIVDKTQESKDEIKDKLDDHIKLTNVKLNKILEENKPTEDKL